ncbi:MAG: YhdH/YhfP family quinone oxidoreductase [Bacteroidota bacterium]
MTKTFQALVAQENQERKFSQELQKVSADSLPEGEVLIRVHFSSLNYKDALSATGHRGVTRKYPHTPGIDASGVVESSTDTRFTPGMKVIVTSYDLGMNTAGGWGQYIRVPAKWVVPCPDSLSLRDSMVLGTAGLTAGLSFFKLVRNGLKPQSGKVLVTGASGGVGSMAVGLFASQGYEVVAATGKDHAHDFLRTLGAKEIIHRSELGAPTPKPLLDRLYIAAIDALGGETLHNVLKHMDREGSVACCGLVDSPKVAMTVYPFILRGVNLLGVDSATAPQEIRSQIWKNLADTWQFEYPQAHVQCTSLEGLKEIIPTMLLGRIMGRVLVEHAV